MEKPLRITSIVKMSTNIGSVILTGTKKTGKQTLFFSLTYFLNDFPWRDFASTETIDTSALASKKERLDNLDQANAEIEKLRKLGEKLTGELQGNVAFLFFSYEKKIKIFFLSNPVMRTIYPGSTMRKHHKIASSLYNFFLRKSKKKSRQIS